MAKTKTIVLFIVLSFFALCFMMLVGFMSLIFTGSDHSDGNVAVIPVNGVILSGDSDSFFGSGIASSSVIVDLIEEANENPEVEAIVIEINSPGGSAVASDEIGQAIKNTNKTTVAWIREVGASGGYWVASTCDTIVANRMSITGSIGVISSYLEFSGLLDDYNITYQRMVSGQYKDLGTPWKELTPEERDLLQAELDLIHDFFVDEVAANRNMPIAKVQEAATGMFLTGYEAKNMGLIDILGGKGEVIEYIESNLGIKAELVRYERAPSLFDFLTGIMYKSSFSTGMGIARELSRPSPVFSLG